ncbi:sensor histidine kinase [Candidatus Enterococcus lemimoniae]|uniref:histidine kinase n=1 Tax=Candidatus Enterococcus lemimoniae TaxID=1834167 RepID=A0ABZ2T925_9ENTE|nr:HAMP domain-containing sensor histidine kinase [Enterococcus sp. 12C11_DIV0727]OTO68121.1 hypothetical protein A5866_000316 [Enterococcus sp. 12C11_DIV0727]
MKKNRATLKQRKNTTQFQLTIRFIGLLISAVLILSLAIMGITVVELYESTEKQADLLEDSLKNSGGKDAKEWQKVLVENGSNDSSLYLVHVQLDTGEVIYSSEDAKEVFQKFSQMKQFLVFDRILWTSEIEPYYYASFQKDEAKVTLLVDMEDQFDLIGRIFSLTIFITLAVIILGSLITHRFSKNLSGSLVVMDEEINRLNVSDSKQQQLTIPKTPQEVQNISKSFNQLLEKQRMYLKREQQFVTDASHELRTPIAAVRGHVNLIKRRGKSHPEVIPTSLSYIDKESKRLESLVEKLLLLGRLDTQFNTEQLDLSLIIQQTINELKVMMTQEAVIKIETGIFLEGQVEHFYQITRNLVENAMKYTEASGTITVTLFSDEGTIQLIVEDSGMGIPDEEKAKVFERFYRVDQSRSSEISGTGIGLSIVKELVEKYQGDIAVTDVLPQGTRFAVTFKTQIK